MPQKRRKSSSLVESPEFNKRITRSSTRQNVQAEHSSTTRLPMPKQEISKAKSRPDPIKSTPMINLKSRKTNDDIKPVPIEQAAPSTPNNASPLTIFSPLTTKPIQCHHYANPNPPTLASHPTLIFTHGAGGTLSTPAVTSFCTGVSSSLPVLAFQGSLNLSARVKGFHACITHVETLDKEEAKGEKRRINVRCRRLLLGGRSMGARAAVMAAASVLSETTEHVGGELRVQLILVSYPLKGPKDVRCEILLDLPDGVEVLFVVGERGAMCPLDMLGDVRRRMNASSRLVVVRGADHGMGGGGKGREREVGEEAGRVAARWVEEGIEGEVVYVGEKG